MEKRNVPCVEDGAEAFAANSAVILVRKISSARGRIKYEVKAKRAGDCSIVDLIPETTNLTSKEVARLLKKAGLTPGEVDEFVKWARRLMSGPSRDEVAALFREVVRAAKEALSGRLDSPYLDLLIPKRDKETLTNCKPSECWQSANAAAVVPAKIDERFGILDFDSVEALEEAESLGFDPKKHMHILAGPAIDAVLTPEGKWRTPDGRVLDDVPRKLHVPVYIPEGCRRNISAPGFELKCLGEINIAGRHPSGAEYEFVDGELLEVSFERLKEFAEISADAARLCFRSAEPCGASTLTAD
jgi:diadenosine tetraphosphate (Ap4A) HIT family hydrolase